MKILKITSLVFLVFLTGCVIGPYKEGFDGADYGSLQAPKQCKTITENKVKSILKDPLTAIFKHDSKTCLKGHLSLPGRQLVFGYLQTGSVNYRDSSGSYTGFTAYRVLIKNGVAIRYCLVNRGEGYCGPRP